MTFKPRETHLPQVASRRDKATERHLKTMESKTGLLEQTQHPLLTISTPNQLTTHTKTDTPSNSYSITSLLTPRSLLNGFSSFISRGSHQKRTAIGKDEEGQEQKKSQISILENENKENMTGLTNQLGVSFLPNKSPSISRKYNLRPSESVEQLRNENNEPDAQNSPTTRVAEQQKQEVDYHFGGDGMISFLPRTPTMNSKRQGDRTKQAHQSPLGPVSTEAACIESPDQAKDRKGRTSREGIGLTQLFSPTESSASQTEISEREVETSPTAHDHTDEDVCTVVSDKEVSSEDDCASVSVVEAGQESVLPSPVADIADPIVDETKAVVEEIVQKIISAGLQDAVNDLAEEPASTQSIVGSMCDGEERETSPVCQFNEAPDGIDPQESKEADDGVVSLHTVLLTPKLPQRRAPRPPVQRVDDHSYAELLAAKEFMFFKQLVSELQQELKQKATRIHGLEMNLLQAQEQGINVDVTARAEGAEAESIGATSQKQHLQALQQELDKVDCERLALSTQLNEETNRLMTVERELAAKDTKLEADSLQINTLKEEIQEMLVEKEKLASSSVAQAAAAVQEVTGRLALVQAKLNTVEKDKCELQDAIKKREMETQQLASELATAVAERDTISHELTETSQQVLIEKEITIKGLKEKLETYNVELEQLKVLDSRGQEELVVVKQMLTKSNEDKLSLELRAKSLEGTVAQLKIDHQEKQERMSVLQLKLEDMTRSKNENKQYAAEIKKKYREMQQKAEATFSALKTEKQALTSQLSKTGSQLKQTQEESTAKATEVASLQKQLASLEAKYDETKSALEVKVKELEISGLKLKERDSSLNLLQIEKDQLKASTENEITKLRAEATGAKEKYTKDTNEMKLKLFDMQASLEKTKAENSELLVYVDQLLRKQETGADSPLAVSDGHTDGEPAHS